MLTQYFRGGAPSFNASDIRKKIWNEYSAVTYHRTFDDYCELIITFGYCSLFCVAFPLAPLFGLIAALVEAKIDAYKLCRLSRRPFPRQADDIGTWQFAMEFMAYAVLFTNLALVCFVTSDLDFTFLGISSTAFEELITAMIVFAILSVVIRIANYLAMRKPTNILMHEKRQEHIDRAMQIVGTRVQQKFRKMKELEVKNWEKWSGQELRTYLRDVLFQNGEIFDKITQTFIHYKFDGSKFKIAEDHDYQDMGLNDWYTNSFLINCKHMLQHKLIEMSASDEIFLAIQNEKSFGGGRRRKGKKGDDNGGRGNLFDDADWSDDEKGGAAERDRGDSDSHMMQSSGDFRFTLDHFMPMADFYDDDFDGQSKRKLYERVDKDSSQIIESYELSSFLYYAIAIYIKSKWRHAQLPDIDDEEFNKQTIRPLKEWLLANKIFDTVGLSFDDFDRTFSSCIWLRKYYPQTADEIQINVVGQRNSGKFDVCLGGNNPSGADNPHLMRTYRKGHLGSDAHGRTEAAAKREMSIGADTMQNIGYQMSTIGQQTIKSQADKLTKKVARNKWTPEATEWLPKLRLVADNASRAPKATREKLFDRLDKKKRGKVNTDRQLMSLVYTFFALYAKKKDRNAPMPQLVQLEPLLIDIVYEIRPMTNGSSQLYIGRDDFVKNIDIYLKSAADNLLS